MSQTLVVLEPAPGSSAGGGYPSALAAAGRWSARRPLGGRRAGARCGATMRAVSPRWPRKTWIATAPQGWVIAAWVLPFRAVDRFGSGVPATNPVNTGPVALGSSPPAFRSFPEVICTRGARASEGLWRTPSPLTRHVSTPWFSTPQPHSRDGATLSSTAAGPWSRLSTGQQTSGWRPRPVPRLAPWT